ncbi:MAG: hypothetical protein WCA37_06560 [Terracidiphilus sp.]
MSWFNRFAHHDTHHEPELDPELSRTLADFKASVHAWSDTAYARPRAAHPALVHRTWRLAAGWAMASVLIAGAGSALIYEHHERVEQARIAAAASVAEQQRQLAAQRAHSEEDLMNKVNTDVSRDVPDAMQPLAALVSYDSTQSGN